MKNSSIKSIKYFLLLSLTALFSGCLDEYIHPLPKCTDAKVINKLDALLDSNSYGSDAKINEELIILVGTNEKTQMKTCKTRVDYTLKNENNDSMVGLINSMPFMNELSKNIEITYTLIQTEDKKDFIINIID